MKITIVTAALMLGACATTPVATVAPICESITTVWVSKEDVLTGGTASQIEGNNLARARLCGKSKPPRTTEKVTS